MATRSDIIVQHTANTWKRVYCHNDGYPEGVGAQLISRYNSQKRAEEVVAPGNMSALYEHCNKPDGHTFDTPVRGYTVYYGRDRDEEGCEGVVAATLAEAWPAKDTWTEFTYVWKLGDGWFIGNPDEGQQTLRPLQAVLDGVEEEPKT